MVAMAGVGEVARNAVAPEHEFDDRPLKTSQSRTDQSSAVRAPLNCSCQLLTFRGVEGSDVSRGAAGRNARQPNHAQAARRSQNSSAKTKGSLSSRLSFVASPYRRKSRRPPVQRPSIL